MHKLSSISKGYNTFPNSLMIQKLHLENIFILVHFQKGKVIQENFALAKIVIQVFVYHNKQV